MCEQCKAKKIDNEDTRSVQVCMCVSSSWTTANEWLNETLGDNRQDMRRRESWASLVREERRKRKRMAKMLVRSKARVRSEVNDNNSLVAFFFSGLYQYFLLGKIVTNIDNLLVELFNSCADSLENHVREIPREMKIKTETKIEKTTKSKLKKRNRFE